MKRISALLLAILILIFALVPSASAVVVSTENGLAFSPGNTRWVNPDYNYAWLDNLFIRDDAMSVTLKELVPKPDDYAYAITCEEFIEECERYIDLYELDDKTFAETYYQIVDVIYYAVVALGMTADVDVMTEELENRGIVLPEEISGDDIAALNIVYASLKNNAMYILYDEEIVIPRGTTLEGALVIILAGITGTFLPSGVNTVLGFAAQATKNYVTEFEDIPLSSNPDVEEIFFWSKVIAAAKNGYDVPLSNYSTLSDAQKEYVNYAYCSTVIELAYDVRVNPVYLMSASVSEEEYAVQKLVLKTMLDTAGVAYTQANTLEELFDLACQNGYFALENEFFSDVLNYEMEVAPSCEKVWFTPITLADQLGGDLQYLKILLNDTEISAGSTVSVDLDTSAEEETILLAVFYNDGSSINDYAVYKFTVIKNPELETQQKAEEGDVVGQIQDYVNSVIPADNEKVSGIFENINSAADSVAKYTTGESLGNFLTTYSSDGADTTDVTYGLEYLETLVDSLYTTDENGNIVTTSVYTVTGNEETTTQTIIEKAVETVTENIEFVMAPTGLIALGGLVGFFMNSKKHRDTEMYNEENNEEEND